MYKIYERGAGVKVGTLEQLRDFDLSSQEVKKIMKARYGEAVPLDKTVISPASVFASSNLVTVAEG